MDMPDLPYYNLEKLVKRLNEYDIDESDLLIYGAAKELHFSIHVAPHKNISVTLAQCVDLVILPPEEIDGCSPVCEREICDTKGTHDNPLVKISSDTVKKILLSESDYSKNNEVSEVDVEILPWCTKNKCKFSNRHNCYVEYEIVSNTSGRETSPKPSRLTCNRFDLIVTRAEVESFEKFLKKSKEKADSSLKEIIPPYLDPENEFYSVTLDLAVRAWKDIFIDKNNLDKPSAGKAGAAFLRSHESGCTELLQKFAIALTPTLAENIAKVAVGRYNTIKKWSKCLKED